MITGQDHHEFGVIAADNIQILIHRIGSAFVPVLGAVALLRRKQIHKLVHFLIEERPAALNVLHQRVRLILRDNADAPDARVQAIRQGKINDAEFPAKVNGRFGPGCS